MCDRCTHQVSSSQGLRRRLWDLPAPCHCPVVGICIPLNTLRSLVTKALGGKTMADDHEIHVGTVAECTKRNRLSEWLQKELEVRHAKAIQAFKSAKTTQAVTDLWAQAVLTGDVSGAFWAALTHPRCDGPLQERLLKDMHMLQHQAAAALSVNVARLQELGKENGILARELGKAQARCTRVITEKSAELAQLCAELVQQRAAGIGKDTRIAYLTQDLQHLKASLPDFEHTARLQKKLEQLSTRQAGLEGQNTQLRQRLAEAQRMLELRDPASLPMPTPTHHQNATSVVPIRLHLGKKTVLCVGGRHGNVANYRNVIEQAGGHFTHHDGGVEDNQNALDAILAAADLVVCQTGYISHNAYWRVKDFCKRTGKQCVFVENPSTTSLARSLQQVAAGDKGLQTAMTQAAS